MTVSEALRVPKGVTAVVGSGGKTSLIDCLCAQLPGTVLRLTTTHCWPPDCPLLTCPTPRRLREALRVARVAAIGLIGGDGKLNAPLGAFEPLLSIADYTLIEADGSHGRPLKAPNDREPVLTGLEKLVIAVAGISGLELPISEAAHRPERYAALTGRPLEFCSTPTDLARVLESEQGQRKNVRTDFVIVLNQCDTPQRLAEARACKAMLKDRCLLTALKPLPVVREA